MLDLKKNTQQQQQQPPPTTLEEAERAHEMARLRYELCFNLVKATTRYAEAYDSRSNISDAYDLLVQLPMLSTELEEALATLHKFQAQEEAQKRNPSRKIEPAIESPLI